MNASNAPLYWGLWLLALKINLELQITFENCSLHILIFRLTYLCTRRNRFDLLNLQSRLNKHRRILYHSCYDVETCIKEIKFLFVQRIPIDIVGYSYVTWGIHPRRINLYYHWNQASAQFM